MHLDKTRPRVPVAAGWQCGIQSGHLPNSGQAVEIYRQRLVSEATTHREAQFTTGQLKRLPSYIAIHIPFSSFADFKEGGRNGFDGIRTVWPHRGGIRRSR